MYIIPGDKVWLSLHQCYWGLFGFTGIFLPVINIYCAVQMLREKPTYRFPLKVFFLSGTVVLLATMVYSFSTYGIELKDYGTELIECFRQSSMNTGTGFLGGVLGIPLSKLLGSVGAGIVTVLIFAFFLLLSFESLFINIIDRVKEPVNRRITEHKETKQIIREEENKIKAEQRRQARDEYVTKKINEKRSAQKQVAAYNDEYRRIDKTPIYEPEPERPAPKKKKTTVSYDPEDQPAVVHPVFSGTEHTENEAPAAPAIKDSANETDPFKNSETLDISELVKNDKEKPAAAKGRYDDALNIFSSSNTPAAGSAPTSQEAASQTKQPQTAAVQTAQPQTTASQSAKPTSSNDGKVRPSELSGTGTPVTSGGEEYYMKPPYTLLEPQPADEEKNISLELQQSASKLVDTLKSFGVQTTIINISRGPSVTRYELQPASGVKISKITNLADDIAMNLAATGVRIEAPIPGKNAVGIEVPNRNVTVVKMRNLIESREFRNAKSKLTVALGMDITGKITLADLSRMPHILIAGSTGSGKSVCINSMLVSLLYKASPDEVKLMLIDPKVVELGVYNGIPHLLVPVVTDPRKAAGALNWAVNEMLERYKTFAEYNVRDMHGYNRLVDKQNAEAVDMYQDEAERTFEEDEMLAQAQAELVNSGEPKKPRKLEKMCQIVIVIDELADLMMAAPNEVEESICRLAQMARAAGMHLVIATQRPSVDVITGLIKANVPSRIAFAVKSQIDSRTILDTGGAEKLLGRGDMLYSPIGTTKPIRIQGCFVNDDEIESIIEFIKNNRTVEYDPDVIDEIERSAIPEKDAKQSEPQDGELDPMMEQAIQCVVEAGQASTSLLQRRLRLGYARAGRLIDEMEQLGIVGPHEGSKPRQVLMTYQQWCERNMTRND